MANLSTYLAKILSAVYGEEVRGAIHDALTAMNEESTSAMTYAKDAQNSAYNAAVSAANSQFSASSSEIKAGKSKTAAESWAVGGTGTRSGEDTNNAKYWSERAENLVFTADTSGAAGIVQQNLNAHAADNTLHVVPIMGAEAPSTVTVGTLGQEYINADAGRVWRCVAINDGVYTWSEMPNILKGPLAPDEDTVGTVGQIYLCTFPTTSNNVPYMCRRIISNDDGTVTYKWNKFIMESFVSDIAVDTASFASDTVPVGTAALRNEYFVDAETTPTVEGQIAWLYG